MWCMYVPVQSTRLVHDTPLSPACANGHLNTLKYLVNELYCDPRSMAHASLYLCIQLQSTRLVTLHSLWPTKTET